MTINDDLTRTIIGCAMNVHNELGNGFQEVIYQRALAIEFQEVIYQRALAIELKEARIDFVREQEIPIYYRFITGGMKSGPEESIF